MKYISTRGGIAPVSFKEAVMMGLATDGGLLLPENLPKVDDSILSQWDELDYLELAHKIFSIFIESGAGEIFRPKFRRFVKIAADSNTSILGQFDTGDPFLIETKYGNRHI